MLIARITGGIGNQLFQYAFIRSLSLKLNLKFFLDLSWYRDFEKFEDCTNPNSATKREFLLDKFKITQNYLNPLYLKTSHHLRRYSGVNKLPLLRYFNYITINEKDFAINNLPLNRNIYLKGIWQNSKLFVEFNDLLKNEILLKNELSSDNNRFLQKIRSTNSIALHIRRGDLINRPNAIRDQPYSSDEYYQEGIKIIGKKIRNTVLYIFSDDIKWVENSLKFDQPTVYINSDGPDFEHFYLMSQCNHNIIANSTYSWWAAWLNTNDNKIIISPKWWYRDSKHNNSIIWIPNNWISLNNI